MQVKILCFLIALFYGWTCLTGCAQSKQGQVKQQGTNQTKQSKFRSSKRHCAWHKLNAGFMLLDPAPHATVLSHINHLHKRPRFFAHLSQNAQPYIYYVSQEVKKRKMPSEIALIPVIESAYDPFAYSHAGAAGLWQLMPGTAAGLGIQQTWWYDGRRSITDSTKAALDYFAYLNKMFKGDWLHTLAAYHAGEGRVLAAIRKNRKLGKPTDFYSLPLPNTTKDYVPKLLAIAHMIERRESIPHEFPDMHYKPYFTSIEVREQIDLSELAKLAKIDLVDVYKLNPGFNRWATSPDGTHELLLPIHAMDSFNSKWNNASNKSSKVRMHTIAKAETLGHIANRYKTTVASIKKANQLKNHIIQPGKSLVVPINYKREATFNKRKDLSKFKQKRGPIKIVHVVKKGDSLSRIARKHGVKIAAIQYWNQLKGNQKLSPGTKLTMWKKRRYKIYKVRSGDSLGGIAYRNKTTITQIKRINKLSSNNIRIGQKLKIQKV